MFPEFWKRAARIDHEKNGPESLKVSLSQFLATKRAPARWRTKIRRQIDTKIFQCVC